MIFLWVTMVMAALCKKRMSYMFSTIVRFQRKSSARRDTKRLSLHVSTFLLLSPFFPLSRIVRDLLPSRKKNGIFRLSQPVIIHWKSAWTVSRLLRWEMISRKKALELATTKTIRVTVWDSECISQKNWKNTSKKSVALKVELPTLPLHIVTLGL